MGSTADTLLSVDVYPSQARGYIYEAIDHPEGSAVLLIGPAEAVLVSLFVEREYRGLGIGTEIMVHVCRRLDELRLPAMLIPLPEDEADQERLEVFYARFGFRRRANFEMARPAKC